MSLLEYLARSNEKHCQLVAAEFNSKSCAKPFVDIFWVPWRKSCPKRQFKMFRDIRCDYVAIQNCSSDLLGHEVTYFDPNASNASPFIIMTSFHSKLACNCFTRASTETSEHVSDEACNIFWGSHGREFLVSLKLKTHTSLWQFFNCRCLPS